MTPEEYQQYKNAEKAHLRKLRELKKAVRRLERRKDVRASLEDVSRSADEALETHQEMVNRLALETARLEARLEIALDSASGSEDPKADDRPEYDAT
ncbi:MAG: hypothetical protein WD021_03415 [Rhodothermales bacterium]